MRRWLTTVIVLVFGSGIFAQGQNVALFKQFNDHANVGYSDCWGWISPNGTEYALMGTNTGISIVRLLPDPNFSGEVEFVPWVSGPWYDIKTYRNYMYVSSEFSNEVLIVDLSTLPDSAGVVGSAGPFSTRPHNIYIDTTRAILFVVQDNFAGKPVMLMDLSDPLNPSELSFVGMDAHDVYAKDSLLFVAGGSTGRLEIYNIQNPASPALLKRVNIPAAGYVHNVWTTDDMRYMFSTEETPGKTVKVWDIQDLNNITFVGEYLAGSRLAHNVMISGDFAYLSHYESGLRILDITDPADPVEIAYYDTYPQNENASFNGAWGVYPFGANGKVYIGDVQSGLYVFEFTPIYAGGVGGMITDAVSGNPIQDVTITFVEANLVTTTNAAGEYSRRTYEGQHTLVFSKPGYFSDTLSVTITAGATTTQDAVLTENLAVAAVSADSIFMPILVNSMETIDLIITNSGPGGRLDYTIDDINGPVPSVPALAPHRNISDFRVDPAHFGSFSSRAVSPQDISSADTVIVDPTGDWVVGSGADIVAVYATRTPADLTLALDFAHPVVVDSTLIVLSLDLDFDVNTGAFPGGFGFNSPAQGIGSEFDIIIDVAGFFGNGTPGYYVWEGSNAQPSGNPLFVSGSSVSGNRIQITIPFSAINDEGNLAIAGFAGNFDPFTGFLSVDYYPNTGNGKIGIDPGGDLPWITLSSASGSLDGGASDTIQVTFDASGYQIGEMLEGYIVVYTNDVNNPVFDIPVTMLVNDALGTGRTDAIPAKFALTQNYPNPFNPATTISYQLPATAQTSLKIFNIVGQEVRSLVDAQQPGGNYTVEWNGLDNNGKQVASGVYFYRLESGSQVQTRKMMLIR